MASERSLGLSPVYDEVGDVDVDGWAGGTNADVVEWDPRTTPLTYRAAAGSNGAAAWNIRRPHTELSGNRHPSHHPIHRIRLGSPTATCSPLHAYPDRGHSKGLSAPGGTRPELIPSCRCQSWALSNSQPACSCTSSLEPNRKRVNVQATMSGSLPLAATPSSLSTPPLELPSPTLRMPAKPTSTWPLLQRGRRSRRRGAPTFRAQNAPKVSS
jgi:hypothetical protein